VGTSASGLRATLGQLEARQERLPSSVSLARGGRCRHRPPRTSCGRAEWGRRRRRRLAPARPPARQPARGRRREARRVRRPARRSGCGGARRPHRLDGLVEQGVSVHQRAGPGAAAGGHRHARHVPRADRGPGIRKARGARRRHRTHALAESAEGIHGVAERVPGRGHCDLRLPLRAGRNDGGALRRGGWSSPARAAPVLELRRSRGRPRPVRSGRPKARTSRGHARDAPRLAPPARGHLPAGGRLDRLGLELRPHPAGRPVRRQPGVASRPAKRQASVPRSRALDDGRLPHPRRSGGLAQLRHVPLRLPPLLRRNSGRRELRGGDASGGVSVGVRLHATGTLSGVPGAGARPVASPDARASLEGFDPRTGRTRWRFEVGRDPGLLAQTRLPPQVGASAIALRTGGHLVALDLASGRRRRLSPSARAWCAKITQYKEHSPYGSAAGPPTASYLGQYALFPCRPDSRRLPPPRRAPAFLGDMGARAAGLVAWSDTSGVFAVPAAR
jgi:hypothetical protein